MSLSNKITSDLVVADGLPPMERPPARVSKTPSGPWEKTVQLTKKIFTGLLVVVSTLVLNSLFLFIPAGLSLYSNFNKKSVQAEVETRRIEHLHTALMRGLEGEGKWKRQASEITHEQLLGPAPKDEATDRFLAEVIELRDQISSLETSRKKGDVAVGSVESVYKRLQKLAGDQQFMQVFRALEKVDHPAVNFLKLLSAKFRSANMSEVLVGHAKHELGEVTADKNGGYSVGKTAEVLASYREKPSFAKNFFWAISHPLGWYHSCESKWLQTQYDNNESNPTYTVQEVDYTTKGNKRLKVRFTAGPTPFNDDAYQKIFLREGRELRFNIMDTGKSEEHEWVRKMDEAAKSSNGHLEHVVLGFVTKEKRGYLESANLDTLIGGYQSALLDGNACRSIQPRKVDNGVVIPEKLLSDEEIKGACSRAKALVRELNPDLTSKHARHAVLVVADTMMAMGTMVNYLEGLKRTIEDESIDEDMRAVFIAAACKQCYDRGPVYLASLMIFFRSLTDSSSLTKDEFYRIAGIPLFRAPVNEGREQQEGKFAVYEELAEMLGSRMDILAKHTRAFRSTLSQ